MEKQGNDIEKGKTVSFATPGKSGLRQKNVVTAADDSDGHKKTNIHIGSDVHPISYSMGKADKAAGA